MFQPQPGKPASVDTTGATSQDRFPIPPRRDASWAWSVVGHRKMLILSTVFGAFLGLLLFLATVKPEYTASSQILIDPADLRAVDNGLVNANNQLPDAILSQLETQVRVLTSDNVLRRVVTQEKLDGARKLPGARPSLLRTVATHVLGFAGIQLPNLTPDPTLAALDELHKRVRVKRAERTFVVDITVTTREREKSIRIANAIAE